MFVDRVSLYVLFIILVNDESQCLLMREARCVQFGGVAFVGSILALLLGLQVANPAHPLHKVSGRSDLERFHGRLLITFYNIIYYIIISIVEVLLGY